MTTAITLPEGAPEEVITHALVREVDLTPFGGKGSLALITLDNGLDHTRPNTFGPQSVAALDAAITDAASRKPAAIAITEIRPGETSTKSKLLVATSHTGPSPTSRRSWSRGSSTDKSIYGFLSIRASLKRRHHR